jgi:hypothetical protein
MMLRAAPGNSLLLITAPVSTETMPNHYSALPRPNTLRRAATLAVFALAAAPLGAQTAPASSSPSTPAITSAVPAPPAQNTVLVLYYEHDFSASLKSGASGKLNENIFGAGSQFKCDWSDNHWIESFGYLFTNNNFSGTNAPLFGNVQQIGFTDKFSHDFSPNWGVFVYGSAGLSAETETSLLNGGQLAVALGPTYQVNQDFSIDFGPMYYTRMQDANTWIPMADAKWAFLPQWELHAFAGVTNGVAVSYDVFNNQATVVEASLDYNSNWFRIRNTAAGAGQSVDETDTTFKIGVRQALSKNVFVRADVSAIFDREYQFHANGNAANSFNVDSTIGLGLELGVTF